MPFSLRRWAVAIISRRLWSMCVMQTNNKIRASFNQQINESVQWTRPIAAVNSPERKKHEKGSNTKLSTWNSNHWILKVNFCLCFKCILEVSMIVEPRPETPTLFPVNFMDHFSFKTMQKRSTILFWIQIGIHYKQLYIAFNLGSSRCLNCEVKFGINIPLKLGFKTVIGIISGLLTSKCQSTMKAKQMDWTAKKDNERNKNNSSRQTDKK